MWKPGSQDGTRACCSHGPGVSLPTWNRAGGQLDLTSRMQRKGAPDWLCRFPFQALEEGRHPHFPKPEEGSGRSEPQCKKSGSLARDITGSDHIERRSPKTIWRGREGLRCPRISVLGPDDPVPSAICLQAHEKP